MCFTISLPQKRLFHLTTPARKEGFESPSGSPLGKAKTKGKSKVSVAAGKGVDDDWEGGGGGGYDDYW